MVESARGGQAQDTTGLCILYQNLINEKIYVALWFWFVLLFVVGSVQILVEVCIIFLPQLRRQLIIQQMGGNRPLALKFLNGLSLLDWFFLYQIGKNVDKVIFGDFVEKIAKESYIDDDDTYPLMDLEDGKSTNVAVE